MQKREDLTPHASSFEYALAGAVYHWVNYVTACGNTSLIEEHSIRYPLAEYMERKCQYHVKLEEGIKAMKRKRYDFFYEYGDEEKGYYKNGYIEVKLFKSETKYDTEISRYFNDIVRLAISGGKCNYFIAFGERKDLSSSFMHVGKPEDDEKLAESRFNGIELPPYGIYTRWFPFEIGAKQYFTVDEFSELKEDFSKSHHDKEDKPINIDGLKIQTQLKAVMPTSEKESSYVVFIWKVERL